MKITDTMEVIEFKLEVGGHEIVIHPIVIYEEGQAVLIDTGFPGSYEMLMQHIDPAYPVNTVILTHQDLDHIGTLPQLLAAANGGLKVYAHTGDQPAIDGRAPFLKASPERLDMMLSALPQPEQDAFRSVFSPETPGNVTHTLHGGELLPFAGGLQVIATPGHTPGHISLYHPSSKTLITADAMVVEDGQLMGPVPQHTLNMEQAIQSLNAFRNLDVETVVCYHGGLFRGDLQQRLDELVHSS
ncbi:MBL fold metallo-hydrolase [Paenibacillus wulumuqiensis]|uniref:MBL fold metallo-hydrolase n=1 Tax=Paenibacillus wulumuqiensis TaxID=1567107 RepID=UPI000619606A|nr:MBL fold metallo-hydrolase [Paenibacillus wulumuqiensis]